MCLILFIMALSLSFLSCSQGPTITQDGDIITISTVEHKLKASKKGISEGTFLVVGGDAMTFPECMNYLDGKLVLIKLAEAERLKTEHGNFLDRENKGNREFRRGVLTLNVIARDSKAKKTVGKVLDMIKQDKRPVVRISATDIRVFELTYKETPYRLSGGTENNSIIETIEVEQKDYPL